MMYFGVLFCEGASPKPQFTLPFWDWFGVGPFPFCETRGFLRIHVAAVNCMHHSLDGLDSLSSYCTLDRVGQFIHQRLDTVSYCGVYLLRNLSG